MRKILKAIDTSNEFIGNQAKWLGVFIFLTICAEVFLRYVFNKPTSVLSELMIMFGAAFYTLGWGYVHRLNRHVRVDVIYIHLPERWRAAIDVIATLIWLLPWLAFLAFISGKWAWVSYDTNEWWTLTYWHPPLWPMRTTIFVGVLLLTFQSLAQLYRNFYMLVRNRAYD